MLDILRREGIYLWYYFDIQLRQILPYWVLGSAISVFAKDHIHRLFLAIRGKRLGALGVIPASLLGIASPLCMYGTIPLAASFSESGMEHDWLAAFILWRYEGSPEAEDFADEGDIAAYAAPAVDWARANGVISGMEGNRFSPRNSATRAQVAVILYRYLNDGETGGEAAGDTIVTNSGQEIPLSVLAHQSAGADAAVYYTEPMYGLQF